MANKNIESTALTLAKGKELIADDFYSIKISDDITVAVVCDGVGSANFGAEAAKRTATFLVNSLKNRPKSWSMQKSITHFIENINKILYKESMQEYERPELVTTLTLIVIESNRLYGANVGDSRIYLLRDNKLIQLSNDHSMDEERYENVLTSAIGLEENVDIYYFENNLLPKDKLLLCSDGVYTEVTDDELIEGMRISAPFLVKKISKKYDDNLPDDTTAVVLDIKDVDMKKSFKMANLKIQQDYKSGEVIDGYKLIKPLIQNRRTWLVSKRGLKYVLKFAPVEAIDDEIILDLFVKEVWNAKRLKAGFFPKAVVPKNRTHRYYIMEYIEGVELKSYIKNKPLGIDLTIELAKFLLKMAQFLIKQDLVHADIKPENIIVYKRKGKTAFKMIDFGSITQVYSEVSRAGTPSYLAPERFSGAPISEQTEIFAIGVTLYESVTKTFPYGEIEPFQNPTFKVAKRPSEINQKMPKWLDAVIMRAIDISPKNRYSHYSQMLYELNNPKKVEPYFDSGSTILERKGVNICRVALIISLLANIAIVYISR